MLKNLTGFSVAAVLPTALKYVILQLEKQGVQLSFMLLRIVPHSSFINEVTIALPVKVMKQGLQTIKALYQQTQLKIRVF